LKKIPQQNPPQQPHPLPPPPLSPTSSSHRSFSEGKKDLYSVVWGNHDPATHKRRLAKLAARIEKESPEEWKQYQKTRSLIAKLEAPLQ